MSGHPSYRQFRTKNDRLDLRLLWNRSLAVLFCLCLVLLSRALLGLGGSREPKNTLLGSPLHAVHRLRVGSSFGLWDELKEDRSSMAGGRGAVGQAHTVDTASLFKARRSETTATETNDIPRAPFFSQERQVNGRLMWSPAQSLLFRSSNPPDDPFAEFGHFYDLDDYDHGGQLHVLTVDLENKIESHEPWEKDRG